MSGLTADARAGLNVALLAFPQAMAYALIAGIPIQYGLFCYIAASLIGPLFGSSRLNSYGPSNATSVLLLSVFLALQLPPEETLLALPVIVCLAGIFLVVGAYLHVATLIQYVSQTVITGYITAAALLIIGNQVKNALGFSIPPVSSFIGVVTSTASQLPQTHWPSLLLSLFTLGVYLLLRRWPMLPNVAVTLVVATIASVALNHFDLAVATLDEIRLADWSPGLAAFNLERVSQFATAALTLAFLITLEAGSIGKSLAARVGDRLNANQEMFGLGMANLASAFCGGTAASASLTRSSLNRQSGARSALTNVFGGLIVLMLLLGLSNFIQLIPKPSLAVVVILIGVGLLNRHNIRIVLRATNSDGSVFAATVATGLLLSLDTAIYVGTILSIVLFLRKVARPEMVEYAFNEEGHLAALKEDDSRRATPEVSIVHVEGELFFGAAELFRDQIRRVCEDPNLKVVILKMRNAHHLDATGVMALEELINHMRERDRHLILSETRRDIFRVLMRSGVIDVLDRRNLFSDISSNPTASTARALKRAREILGDEDANVSIYFDRVRDEQKKAERAAGK